MPSRHYSNWDVLSYATDKEARDLKLRTHLPRDLAWRERGGPKLLWLAGRLVRSLGRRLSGKPADFPRFKVLPTLRSVVLLLLTIGGVLVIMLWEVPKVESSPSGGAWSQAAIDAGTRAAAILRAKSILIGAFAVIAIVLTYRPNALPLLAVRSRREAVLRRAERAVRLWPERSRSADRGAAIREVAARRAYWASYMVRLTVGERLRMCNDTIPSVALWPLALSLTLMVSPKWLSPCSLVVVMFVSPAVLVVLISARRLNKLRGALSDRTCPDCRYSLADLPDGVTRAFGALQDVGPARCCECGSPWPLLPPPIPSHLS